MRKEFQKNFKSVYPLVISMGLLFGGQTLSASEADDFNGNGKSDIKGKKAKGKKHKVKKHKKIKSVGTYFDVSFPIDTVNYSAVSVDESNMSVGARQLAAQCAQCHGTNGVAVAGWPDLWGSGRGIAKWMQEYQDAEEYIDNVMYLHAIAYTKDEVKLIKEYYQKVEYEGGE